MKTIRAKDGQKLNYSINGEGSPIILLHGWAMGCDYFISQIKDKDLSQKFSVIVPDLRGMGSSTLLDAPFGHIDLETYADDLYLLISLETKAKVSLLGWSFGALIIWKYIEKYGVERLSSIVIVEMVDYMGDPSWAAEENTTIKLGFNDYLNSFLPSMYVSPPSPEILQHLTSVSKMTSQSLAIHLNTVMANSDLRDVLPNITVPTLLIYGDNELFFSEEEKIRTKNAIPNCEFATFASSKHCPFIEEPTAFNDVITKFLLRTQQDNVK